MLRLREKKMELYKSGNIQYKYSFFDVVFDVLKEKRYLKAKDEE